MKKNTLAAILVLASLLAPRPALKAQTAANDTLAIIETAMNYGDGFYSGSAERMEKAISPDFIKLAANKLPNSDRTVLIESTYSGLIEMSRAKIGLTPEASRKIEVKVILIAGDLAFARLASSQFNDYLAMARIDGAWKIVNVLWAFGESSPNRPVVPVLKPDEQKPLAEQAVRSFIEGLYLSDPATMEKVMHIRFTQATVNKMPQTGKPLIARDGYDLTLGYAFAKLGALDKTKWNYQVSVLDYMDGMALATLTTANGANLVELLWTDGQWKIVSMLRKRG